MAHPMSARTATLLLCLLAVAGCVGPRSAATSPDFRRDGGEGITITIRNQQLDEVRVWLWLDGHRRRLGPVRANETETFFVPLSQIVPVSLEFDVTLGAHCVTSEVSLGPGERIAVDIPLNLSMMVARCR